MMNLYGAEHHLMVVSDSIDAEEHRHSFLQVTISLTGEFDIEVAGQGLSGPGIIINSNVVHRLKQAGHPLMLLLMIAPLRWLQASSGFWRGSRFMCFRKE